MAGWVRARLLVVEDDDTTRGSLSAALRAEGYEVASAGDGLSALETAARFSPDLAIIDIGLPRGPDGLAVARRLRAERPLGVLFVTGADTLGSRLEGFSAGADDYLGKPFDLAELLARVQAILRRIGHDSGTLTVGDLVVDEAAGRVVWRGEPVGVSATELALLAALARHRGQVVTKRRLLTLVWGQSHDPNVVEVSVGRLRRKLRAAGADPIRTIHGRGYALELP